MLFRSKTGKPDAAFGGQGWIDLRDDLGRPKEGMSVGLTTPGVVYGDLLIIGSICSEGLPAAPGDIRAYDARTGKLRWSFHTIPHPGEFGYDTWPKDGWKNLGAANNWAGMALDVKRGLVYVPTGSAAYDFFGANRPGNNLFANTLLCLDAKTGHEIYGGKRIKSAIYSSSPVLADGKLYVTNEDGLVTVLQAGPEFKVLSENDMKDYTLSSPAVSDGQLFVRTAGYLYCIGKRSGKR